MHIHVYRDASRSGHIDLVGEGDNPWVIDLVMVVTAAMLLVSFFAALVAHVLRA
jgi:hypothetical protein